MVGICALVSFAQNASAQNAPSGKSDGHGTLVDNAPNDKNKRDFKAEDRDYAEHLMNKIPYSQSLKYSWHVVDGDVDLYFEDLRVDRGNKGISYTTQSLPMFGEIDGAELRAELGEDSQLSFQSDYMPFVGHVDGFQFRAAAGTDDSRISLRYKIDLGW